MLVLASTSNRDLVEVLQRDHRSSNIYLYYYYIIISYLHKELGIHKTQEHTYHMYVATDYIVEIRKYFIGQINKDGYQFYPDVLNN